MSCIGSLRSQRCFPILLCVHLALLLSLYCSWYAREDKSYINIPHNVAAGTELHLSVDQAVLLSHDIWVQPLSGNRNIASAWNAVRNSSHATERVTFPTDVASTSLYQFVFVGKSLVEPQLSAETNPQVQRISWGTIHKTNHHAPHSQTVVMFEHCQHQQEVNFFNIYAYYDEIAHCAVQLRLALPNAVVVWIRPDVTDRGTQSTLSSTDIDELELLHMHLAHSYLVRQIGLIVVSGARQAHTYYTERQRSHAFCAGAHMGGVIGHGGGFLRHNELTNSWQTTIALLECQLHYIEHSVLRKPSAQSDNAALQLLMNHRHTAMSVDARNLHSACYKYTITRKYDARCHPPSSLTHPFLITGLGGAGTHYIAKTLRMQGWQVLHEDMDKDGAVSWIYAASDWAVQRSYPYGALPAGKSSFLQPRFGHVVHLVRSPLDQISSFTAHSNKTYDFVLRTMELFLHNSSALDQFKRGRSDQRGCHRGGDCHLEFAALSWLHWNRFVHSFADITFRVEQVVELQEHICRVASAAAVSSAAPLSPLMTSRRYCDISGCPAVNYAHQSPTVVRAAEKLGFAMLDKAFGVCALNEALFRRSAAHKRHHRYTWTDISTIDTALAVDIQSAAREYGFTRD